MAKHRTIQYITLSLNVRRFSGTSSQGRSSSDVDTTAAGQRWCDDLKK